MKAVFIDGPSLHNTGHAMGIAKFNLNALNKFLTEEVGAEKEMANRVIVTVTPAMGKKAERAWRNAGYEVLEVTSADSEDDQAIIQRIAALDFDRVKEVVMVSTDQDYIAVLRQKAQQGMKVWWVGSSAHGHNGNPLMSTSLKPFLGTEFEFVDLVSHKDRLMGLPTKMPPVTKGLSPTRLKVELNITRTREENMEFISALTRLLRKFPYVTYKIEG